jgi:HAD superfamily hydrolase (TIGR01509 family)
MGLMKPEPEIYLKAISELKEAPSNTLFIDDKSEFTEAATKLGINSIQFTNYEHLIKQLKEYEVVP